MSDSRGPAPRATVASLQGYEWEESSASIARRFGLSAADVVRFDTNTVPWVLDVGPAVPVGAVNEYPDSTYPELVAALAGYVRRPPACIVLGAGADELIGLVAQAFLDDRRVAVQCDPAYAMFAVATGIAGATLRAVPVNADLSADVDALCAAAADADVVWLANPDNPTGLVLPPSAVARIAAVARGVVVVDEAYLEFAQDAVSSCVGLADNVVVLRTFSKAFGLAAARVGYAIAPPAIAGVLSRIRPVNPISAASAELALCALRCVEQMRANVAALVAERGRLAASLRAQGRDVVEGGANFVLVAMADDEWAGALAQGLVMRRYRDPHRLAGWSRITVRSAADNARLLSVLGR